MCFWAMEALPHPRAWTELWEVVFSVLFSCCLGWGQESLHSRTVKETLGLLLHTIPVQQDKRLAWVQAQC